MQEVTDRKQETIDPTIAIELNRSKDSTVKSDDRYTIEFLVCGSNLITNLSIDVRDSEKHFESRLQNAIVRNVVGQLLKNTSSTSTRAQRSLRHLSNLNLAPDACEIFSHFTLSL